MTRGDIERRTLNERIKPEVRDLLDAAEALTGKNQTRFVPDTTKQARENAIMGQTRLVVSQTAFRLALGRRTMPGLI